MSHQSFSSLNLKRSLADNLASLGYYEMTEVQAQSLPPMLEGGDVIAQAKTGSGKTAAFALNVLQQLDVEQFRVQALILCPTRELADQVAGETRRLARGIPNVKVLTLCGGQPIGPQIGSLEHGAHIVVGTPGRIEEHLRKKSLDLKNVRTFVLDEADRMLDMGFQPALDAIIQYVPARRQTLLFSATYPGEIRKLAGRVMSSPAFIKVESTHTAQSIQQYVVQVGGRDGRFEFVVDLLLSKRPDSALVFCNMKSDTQQVADRLKQAGFTVRALHGDMDQRNRDETLVSFANRSVSVLVATDVAARGIDVEDIGIVINYQLPRDDEVYIHRIGRTARAGKQGLAVSLFDDAEANRLASLEAFLKQPLETLPPLPAPEPHVRPYKPPMITLQIDGGRKQKVRPGDIVGALTRGGAISADDVGKIHIFDQCAYVAVKRSRVREALATLREGKIKGRLFRVRER